MKRRSTLRGGWISVVLGAFAIARAAVVPVESTRFDDRLLADPSARIGIVAERPESLEAYAGEIRGWAEFRKSHGPSWSIHVDRRSGSPTLVEGQGIRWFPAGETRPVEDLEARAREFVSSHGALFRVSERELAFQAEGSGYSDADHATVLFDRVVGGVPVEDERFLLHVVRGNLVAFGADRWGRVSPREPEFGAETAREALYAHLGLTASDSVEEIESGTLVYVGVPAKGAEAASWKGAAGEGIDHLLAWRFALRVAGERGTWVGKVDAATGEVIALYDDDRYAQVKGGVYPVSSDADGWDGTEQPGWPMPYADVTIDGVAAIANDMGVFDCADPGSTVLTHLQGPYIRVNDTCGALSQSAACEDNLDLLQGTGTDCSVPAGMSAGDTHSARSSFYHLNRVMEKGRAWLPGNAWLKQQVTDNVNISPWCNAQWNGAVNFYMAASGCRNTGEIAGIFVHEWGHGIDQNDGGGYDNPSEAYADVVAFIQTHVSCVGRGFFTSQNCSGYGDTCLDCTGIRDQDWDMHVSHAPATPQEFLAERCGLGSGPCGKEVHCESYVAGQTVWDLAARDLPAAGLDAATAWQQTEKLFYLSRKGSGGNAYNCALPSSDGCGVGSWFTKFRAIDDDDGNLSNGTPHAAAIYAAFARHHIACGGADDESNQSYSTCPALPAPELSAAGGSASASLSWTGVPGAASYRILRNDQGCSTAHTIVATVPAPTTSYVDVDLPNGFPLHYAVQAQGLNSACDSAVSTCVTAVPEPFAGSVELDRAQYGCGAVVTITVRDANAGGIPLDVLVWSESEPAPETVALAETLPGSGKFVGTIGTSWTSPAPGDGLVALRHGDLLTAQYVDADDGLGGTGLVRQAVAAADCQGPAISLVTESSITDVEARVTWTTNEASDSAASYGSAPPPAQVAADALSGTEHSVLLTGLSSCTTYYYSVRSRDAAGNVTVDDNGGVYHHFETLGNFGAGLQPCHAGTVALDRSVVGCVDALPIRLVDIDLNVSPLAVETAVVLVSSSTEFLPETVVLTETGVSTSVFAGQIPTSPGAPTPGDGVLQTSSGDAVTATYEDADDGTGAPAVSFRTALADCAAPDLSGVIVRNVTDESAVVEWTTSEAADGRVEWGITPALGSTLSSAALTTGHSFALSPLDECGRIYFRVASKDAFGNVRTLDASGVPFEFNANEIPGWIFKDEFEAPSGWTLDGEWQVGPPQGKGSTPPDPSVAFEHASVLGHDLTGLGSYLGDYETGTTQYATSPAIDATSLRDGQIKFRRWLNVGGGGTSSVEVKDGATWRSVWQSSTGGLVETTWSLQTIDISAYADGNPALQLRFRQYGGSSSAAHRSGWNVDRLVVNSGASPDFDACGACGGTPSFAGAASAADADPCGDTGITLRWKAAPAWGSGHAGTYAVYRDTSPVFEPSPANLVVAGWAGTMWTDPAAPNDVDLYYVVRAENDETCSTGPANGGTIDANLARVTGRDETWKAAPGDVGASLLAAGANDAHVRLSWKASSATALYRVYRSQFPEGPYVRIGDTADTWYEDRNQLGYTTPWFYVVKGVNACGVEGP